MFSDAVWLRGMRALLVLAVIVISWLAFAPHPPEIPLTENDKVDHISAFLALAFLMDQAFPQRRFLAFKTVPLLGYGIFIEVVQGFLGYREMSVLDFGADCIGVSLFYLLRKPLRFCVRNWLLAKAQS